jgi:hypothetical protein
MAMTRMLSTIGAALLFGCVVPSFAQEGFDSPEAAATAIIDAADSHDSTKLSAILGPQAKGILTTGNATRDTGEQTEFARLARMKHRIQMAGISPNRAILCIGDEDWPFPVPIVKTKDKWSFDASQTQVEMRARLIGAHELDVMEICRGYVEAQRKYASEDRDKSGMLVYAAHLMSSPGKHDGLYWEGAGEPLVPEAFARAESGGAGKDHPKPYHGYYFRVLQRQGPSAPGGAHTYVAKDKLIGGFGLVAWPAEYGVTGIHTFIVNQTGAIFQKDIAPVPGKPSPPITSFDPGDSWQTVD